MGVLYIRHASSAYDTSFSTILRTTRNPELDLLVPPEETTGAEPLSKELASARVIIRQQQRRTADGETATRTFFAVDTGPDEIESVNSNASTDSQPHQDCD